MSEKVEEVSLKRMVVFAILMESGKGISDKSPEYVEEKFMAAMTVLYPEKLLDVQNRAKLESWKKEWIK